MSDFSARNIADDLELTPWQVAATRTFQARMLLADLESTENKKRIEQKLAGIEHFISAAMEELRTLSTEPWLPQELLNSEVIHPLDHAKLLASLAARLSTEITDRTPSVIILAELLTFSPWESGTKWNRRFRKKAIDAAAVDLAALRESDLETMSNELEKLVNTLRRKSVKWGRVAAVAVVGAGVGVLTGGLAAPAIGGAVGASMGLTGAAATSAGLAALGGGSIAAGGFGVFGGTILLTGVSGLTFASAAAAGTRYSPIAASAIGAEAVKLDLIARMILAESPHHDEKLRRVAESLQESINVLSERTRLLVAKIDELKAEKARTDAENAALKEQIKLLKTELDDSRNAQITLSVVCERISSK